jgi:two-component system response regulator HydG
MTDHATPARAPSDRQVYFDTLIGESASMLRLFDLIEKISQCSSPVLITGETGTGKELVARAIHFSGKYCKKAFVPIDCSALTPSLIESELFGHVKGAFTGADQSRTGLLQSANEGTIFLDEIGELPINMQAKLLRALQEKEIRPVGSSDRIPIQVRIIAATNRDLESEVRAGTFRMDLFFRLNVLQTTLPTLRERKEDIPLLVNHFLKKFSDPLEQQRSISEDGLRRLNGYDWPGNVRELENVIECALALSSGNILTADDLATQPYYVSAPDANACVTLAELQHRAILYALWKTDGNRLAAARLLGMGKTTLYRKLIEYAKVPQTSLGAAREEITL